MMKDLKKINRRRKEVILAAVAVVHPQAVVHLVAVHQQIAHKHQPEENQRCRVRKILLGRVGLEVENE